MSETLPAAIVTEVEALGRALLRLSREQADRSLAATETAFRQLLQQVVPGLFRAVLLTSQTTLHPGGSPPHTGCPQCRQRVPVHSWRVRQVQTSCGRLSLDRPWYHCSACQQGFSPTDQTLGLGARTRLSEPLADWVVQLGAATTFAEASRLLGVLTGVNVSPETIRQLTETRGQAFEAQTAARSQTVLTTQEAAEPVDVPPGTLTVETDGVMVRYQDGWHEVRIGVVGGSLAGETTALSYVAARESVDAFGHRLLAEAARRGALEVLDWHGSPLRRQLAVLPTVLLLGDGAPWIWRLGADYFGTRLEVLDYYHATEHLWTVAQAVFGEGTTAARDWAAARSRELQASGPDPVHVALARLRPLTPEAATVVRRERQYFRTHAGRLDYPAIRAQGLPIGSGAVESAAKHLIQHRLKRAGARWSEAGARGVIAVRCRLSSNRPLSLAQPLAA